MNWDFELVDGPYDGVLEGPAWDGTGLLFTDIRSSRIMRYDPQTESSTVYLEGTNYSNGLMFDPLGVLYACEGDARRVVRYDNGIVKVLSDGFGGRPTYPMT